MLTFPCRFLNQACILYSLREHPYAHMKHHYMMFTSYALTYNIPILKGFVQYLIVECVVLVLSVHLTLVSVCLLLSQFDHRTSFLRSWSTKLFDAAGLKCVIRGATWMVWCTFKKVVQFVFFLSLSLFWKITTFSPWYSLCLSLI